MEQEILDILTEDERKVVTLCKAWLTDTIKFRQKKTASAATRARKASLELAKIQKDIRKTLQTDRSNIIASRKAAREQQ